MATMSEDVPRPTGAIMSENQPPAKAKYFFENDVSGRLFCWLIESGEIDYGPFIDDAFREGDDEEAVVKRLAKSLKHAVKACAVWTAQSSGPQPASAAQGDRAGKAPSYSLWFRPSPSTKIKFKEVARALLVFHGRLP
jgi:hypothetical protein